MKVTASAAIFVELLSKNCLHSNKILCFRKCRHSDTSFNLMIVRITQYIYWNPMTCRLEGRLREYSQEQDLSKNLGRMLESLINTSILVFNLTVYMSDLRENTMIIFSNIGEEF